MREFKKKNGGLLCVHSIHLVTWIYEQETLEEIIRESFTCQIMSFMKEETFHIELFTLTPTFKSALFTYELIH